MAVQFEASVAQVDGVEAAFHDLERGHLLRDEEDGSAAGERLADQVGDRLGLARARRSLDDQVAPVHGVEHREGLRAVRVDHRVQAGLAQVAVGVPFLAEFRGLVREAAAAEELLHERMVGRAVLFGPARQVEVLVDEQLAEREEVQVDLVALDGPARLLGGHRPLDSGEVVLDVEVILRRHLGEAHVEVLLQLRLE